MLERKTGNTVVVFSVDGKKRLMKAFHTGVKGKKDNRVYERWITT
jgi:hypothetical protein